MKLANLEITEENLVVSRATEPYLADLKRTPGAVGPFMMMFATTGVITDRFFPGAPRHNPYVTGIFCALWPAALWWVPVLLRVIEGLRPMRVRFCKLSRKVFINDEFWSDFDNIASVRIVTKLVIFPTRRFRLVLDSKLGGSVHIVDTPVWVGTLYSSIGLGGDMSADNREFPVTGGSYRRWYWRPFQVGMRCYDKNDPLVLEIFHLRDLIRETLLAE